MERVLQMFLSIPPPFSPPPPPTGTRTKPGKQFGMDGHMPTRNTGQQRGVPPIAQGARVDCLQIYRFGKCQCLACKGDCPRPAGQMRADNKSSLRPYCGTCGHAQCQGWKEAPPELLASRQRHSRFPQEVSVNDHHEKP